MAWSAIEDINALPSGHMVLISNDDCSVLIVSKFDDDHMFYLAEDGFPMSGDDLAKDYCTWCPAPDGFRPRWMEITPDDWR